VLVLYHVHASIFFLARISLVYHVSEYAGRALVFWLVLRKQLDLLLQLLDMSTLILNNLWILYLLYLTELLQIKLLFHLGLGSSSLRTCLQ
jgi:hypothetical protein